MSDGVILVVAPEEDLHARAVKAVLRRSSVRVAEVDTQDFPAVLALTLEWPHTAGSRLVLRDGTRLRAEEIDTVWWRRQGGYRIDKAVGGAAEREYARVTSRYGFESFVSTLHAFMVNDIWMQYRAERKGFQLEIATQCGLRIPATIITNDAGLIREALASHPVMVYKSLEKVVGVADGTKILEPEDLARLSQLRHGPAIFQEYVEPGYDLRIYIIGETVYAAKLTSDHASGKVDIRLDFNAHVSPYVVPAEVQTALFGMMKKLGLVFGAIDMKVDREGNHFFLEVNPAGQWIYIEVETGQPITETLAAYLAAPHRSFAAA